MKEKMFSTDKNAKMLKRLCLDLFRKLRSRKMSTRINHLHRFQNVLIFIICRLFLYLVEINRDEVVNFCFLRGSFASYAMQEITQVLLVDGSFRPNIKKKLQHFSPCCVTQKTPKQWKSRKCCYLI